MSTQKNTMEKNRGRAWYIRGINWFKKIIQDFMRKIKVALGKKLLERSIKQFEKDRKNDFKALRGLGMTSAEADEVIKNYIKMENGMKKLYDSWDVVIKYSGIKEIGDLPKEEYKKIFQALCGVYEFVIAAKESEKQLRDYDNTSDLHIKINKICKNLRIEKEGDLEKAMIAASILAGDLSAFKEVINKIEDPNFIYDEEYLVQSLFAVGHDEFVEVLMDTGKIDYDKKIVSGYGEGKTVGELIDEMSPKLSNKRMQTKIENKIHAKDKKENEPNIKEEEIMQKQLVDAYLNGNLAVFKEIVNKMENPDFYLHEGILGERNPLGGNRTVSAMIIDSDGYYGHAEYLEALLATGKVDLGKRAYTDRDIMRDRRTVGERIENYCKLIEVQLPNDEKAKKLESTLQQQKLEMKVKNEIQKANYKNPQNEPNIKKDPQKSL